MGMTIDGLEKECQYCYREIDNSGLEGFRCTNRTAIKARDSSWCYPKNANEPCSICEYCEPKQDMGMTIDEAIKRIDNIMFTKFTTVKDEDAFLTAIDTMRKYQKIDWITQAWDDDENAMILVHKIREVIEDDND